MEINEIIEQRKAKIDSLKAKGVCVHDRPFPGRIDIAQAKAAFQEGSPASVAGRIVAKRLHGKVTFLDIRDASEKLQLYLKEDYLSAEKLSVFDDLDIADIIAVKGELFKTRTGEITMKVQDVAVLTKALRPLPEKWHGLKDVELRYRQRYLDLIANEDVKKVFKARSDIIKAMRGFLDAQGFQEVETPMMHDVPGGAAGRPFKTFHNVYNRELYMRIAPELYLKRLLVGGLDRVYEINRSFRNEGISTRHNPEFTMLEVYWAYADYTAMMDLCEKMFASIAQATLGTTSITYQGKTIDLAPPWQRRSFADMVREKFGIAPSDAPGDMLAKLQAKGFAKDKQRLSRSQIAKIIEEILGEDMSESPTFVTDYFTVLCPLAKAKKDDPLVSERFELYIAGMEVANAYSELNDPVEQKRRFEEEIQELDTAEAKSVDEDYVHALQHGMPSAGGLGVGVDRLVMLLTDQASIRDVILFPLLKPHAQE